MHWKILDSKRGKLLKILGENNIAENFYMAGGTALSLQLGLRKSMDFDFFTPYEFNSDTLLAKIEDFGRVDRVISNYTGTLDIVLNGVKISFFNYPYPLICDTVYAEKGIQLASVLDIAVMKLSAIGGRGAKKDFFDLYCVLTMTDLSHNDIINAAIGKFGDDKNLSYMIMGLSYFDDARTQELPETYIKKPWEKIEEFFEKHQPEFETSYKQLITKQQENKADIPENPPERESILAKLAQKQKLVDAYKQQRAGVAHERLHKRGNDIEL